MFNEKKSLHYIGNTSQTLCLMLWFQVTFSRAALLWEESINQTVLFIPFVVDVLLFGELHSLQKLLKKLHRI